MQQITSLERGLARGERLLSEQLWEDAARQYAYLSETYPYSPDAWFNLAWLQRLMGSPLDAIQSYNNAICHGIVNPQEAYLNQSTIWSEVLLDTQMAIKAARNAVEVAPEFALGWYNLGQLYEDQGDRPNAKAALLRAIECEPSFGRAHVRLTALESAYQEPGAIERLEKALELSVERDDYADILFALGNALDAAGRFDEAFIAVTRANEVAASLSEWPYDQQQETDKVQMLIGSAKYRDLPVATTHIGPRPVFICGMFRSGSTLVEQMLSHHPNIYAAGEGSLVPEYFAKGDRLVMPTLGHFDEFKERYSTLMEVANDKTLFVDKRCDNYYHIQGIKRVFPNALFIHTKRRPLDNFLSLFFLRLDDSQSYSTSLDNIAHHYREYMKLMNYWCSIYRKDIFDFDYDAAVRSPEESMRRLLAFLGLPWTDDCLSVRGSNRPVRTASAWHVRQPIHQRSSGRSRHYVRYLQRFSSALDTPDPTILNVSTAN